MEKRLNENKWALLAWSSLAVAGAYIILDIYNKKHLNTKLKSKKFIFQHEENGSLNSSYGEISMTQISDPLLIGDSRKLIRKENDYNIHKICITGGPCAGKTTGLAYVAEKLREHDIAVFIVPEAASLIFQGGGMIIKRGSYTDDIAISFQTNLLLTQYHLEETFMELAQLAKQEAVILTDRGLMDGSAYIKPECWQTLMDEKGWNEAVLRDRRYDAVIHLVTAANGASEFYNMANPSRYENDLSLAVQVDMKTQNAWMGHSNFIIIDNKNTKSFDHKKNRLLNAIFKVIGKHAKKLKYKRRFLLDLAHNQKPDLPKDVKIKKFEIEDTFLKEESNPEDIIRVRKSYSNGYYTYTYSCKMAAADKENIRTKRQISQREFNSFLFQRDINKKTIKKQRICFIGKSYFIIDTYLNDQQFSLLKIEVEDKESEVDIPESLKILREVTGAEEYRSYYLSNKQWLFPEEDLKFFYMNK